MLEGIACQEPKICHSFK